MLKRTIEISREPAHLATENRQLLVLRQGQSKRDVPMRARLPLEDLGMVVVDHRETTYSHNALAGIAEHGAVLLVCDRRHLPAGILLPLPSHTELVWRIRDQIQAGKVIRKQLWKQLVVAKVRAQASNLNHDSAARRKLLSLARRVRSGDPENIEAQASRIYWPVLFASGPLREPFRRSPGGGKPPNNLLDYGYAIMRAAVARAIVGAGMLPMLGIKHENRSNAFCLADDLVEPLRPIVDRKACCLFLDNRLSLEQPVKAELLSLLDSTVKTGDATGPLQVALARYAAAFARCLAGEQEDLTPDVPVLDEPPGSSQCPT